MLDDQKSGVNDILSWVRLRFAAEKSNANHEVPNFSMREQQVLALIAEGCSTKEIAARLAITFGTAACHRRHLLAKAGARNCVVLVRFAIRHGLIEP
jgi:DNA-binding NarL/FixJ family response regulator